MGLIWAKVFTLVELQYPGSFDLIPPEQEKYVRQFGATPEAAQFVYYSYITLTTVGYGDITPVSPAARTLAMLEGLIGQLYIAIMIARIVGIQVSTSMKESDRGPAGEGGGG